jgi:hypothetical protein
MERNFLAELQSTVRTTTQTLSALLKSARDILLRECFGGQVMLSSWLNE